MNTDKMDFWMKGLMDNLSVSQRVRDQPAINLRIRMHPYYYP
jgi:hypothetical protein